MVMIAFVVLFLVWLLVGLGCGLPGIVFYYTKLTLGWSKCR